MSCPSDAALFSTLRSTPFATPSIAGSTENPTVNWYPSTDLWSWASIAPVIARLAARPRRTSRAAFLANEFIGSSSPASTYFDRQTTRKKTTDKAGARPRDCRSSDGKGLGPGWRRGGCYDVLRTQSAVLPRVVGMRSPVRVRERELGLRCGAGYIGVAEHDSAV